MKTVIVSIRAKTLNALELNMLNLCDSLILLISGEMKFM